MTRPTVRIGGQDPALLLPIGVGSVSASATVQPGDTLTTIPFDSGTTPIISRGYMLDSGDNGGALVFKKTGFYKIEVLFRACVLAGGVGTFEFYQYNNGVKSSLNDFAVDVDFANDRKNVLISFSQILAITQSILNANGGSYSRDFRVKTSDAAITWRYGNTNFTSGYAATAGVTRLCEYYT
jgi:hypothetical protein